MQCCFHCGNTKVPAGLLRNRCHDHARPVLAGLQTALIIVSKEKIVSEQQTGLGDEIDHALFEQIVEMVEFRIDAGVHDRIEVFFAEVRGLYVPSRVVFL